MTRKAGKLALMLLLVFVIFAMVSVLSRILETPDTSGKDNTPRQENVTGVSFDQEEILF